KMLFSSLALLACVAGASAHFQMQFPPPRGPFVEPNEVNFCDSYTDAVSNRSLFPLDNGYITLNSEHPVWTAAVLISIDQNPTNFSVFNISSSGIQLPFAVPFFQTTGEGAACIPVDIGKLNISGIGDGSNVTLQVEFNGGDGNLFQCTDITLSSNFSIPSSDNCTHIVTNTTVTGSNASGT
ncbi:hypothetical protein SCHPADRAFT_795371, partial [Schizopora paradoxa]